MPKTALETLAAFVDQLEFDGLPAGVRQNIPNRFLDTIGVCVGGLAADTSSPAEKLARDLGGAGQATMIGTGLQVGASSAALFNGILAHTLDFDDTHLPSILHPSASIVPTALAMAETTEATGKEVITAAVCGYEVCIRTGMAAYDENLRNSVFFDRGWHATSVCGALGAAATAAKLLKLGSGGVGDAISIAASMASGLLEANRSGGSVKKLHCGWAANCGIVAARAAAFGFSGPPTIFEGRFGFYNAFCSGVSKPELLTEDLGARWSVDELFYKPYPANHFAHTAIDAARVLRQRLDASEIVHVEVGVAGATLRTLAQPREKKIKPLTGYQAQFSGPFLVASALTKEGGGLGLGLDDVSNDAVKDEVLLKLAERVHFVADSRCDRIFPYQLPAIVTVTTTTGDALTEQVLVNRGGPANRLSDGELRQKFLGNAEAALGSAACGRIIEELDRLVTAANCRELMRLTGAGDRRAERGAGR